MTNAQECHRSIKYKMLEDKKNVPHFCENICKFGILTNLMVVGTLVVAQTKEYFKSLDDS